MKKGTMNSQEQEKQDTPVMSTPIRRNYKDTVFRRIFNNKKELLELYNALNHSNHENPQDIEIITLDNALFLKMKNDVAFLINTSEMCLIEHSSTVCLNYPLRSLLYLAKEYEAIIKVRNVNILQYSQVKIPTPRCIVLYNGQTSRPERETLRLSDAFENKDVEGCLELTVDIININLGNNKELFNSCKTLRDYAILVSKVREFKQDTGNLSEAISKAIDYCIEKDYLREFLVRNRVEVESMLLSEGTVEEYVDSMDKELERMKQEVSQLKKIVQEKDTSLKEFGASLKSMETSLEERDASLKLMKTSLEEKDLRIRELEQQLAEKSN